MKKLILILSLIIILGSCKKEQKIYIDNSRLVQYALTLDSVELITCNHGTLKFPDPNHTGYNAAMKIMFNLNPNILIKFEPIEYFDCDSNKKNNQIYN